MAGISEGLLGCREKYYEKLKVKPGASMDEVNRACRDQVKFWHPDRFPSMSTRLQNKAHEMLQEINAAYKKIQEFHKQEENKKKDEKSSFRKRSPHELNPVDAKPSHRKETGKTAR